MKKLAFYAALAITASMACDTKQSLNIPNKKALYTANLAWGQTQIGLFEQAERKKYLVIALATFEKVNHSDQNCGPRTQLVCLQFPYDLIYIEQ